MATRVRTSVMNVLGASIDPKRTRTLDPSTAHQRYDLWGRVDAPPERGAQGGLALRLARADPNGAGKGPELTLNLVRTVRGTVGLDARGDADTSGTGDVGGSDKPGSMQATCTWTPVSPLGQNQPKVTAGMRS